MFGTTFRKWIAILIGLILVASGFSWFYFSTSRTNLLLITLDTTRADHIGCYGYSAAETPFLDRLAREGVLFENAYAVCPVTLPTHTTMLTGLMPREHGIHHNGLAKLGSQFPTLAETLSSSGYASGAFIGAFVLHRQFGLHRGFDTYDDQTGGEFIDGQFHRRRKGQWVVDAALKWLQGLRGKPFFCWVHLYDAHAPYSTRKELYGDRFTSDPYNAGIGMCDRQVGRLIEFLKQQRLLDSTMIVVIGDHGEGLGEHHEREHGHLLYNSTLQVPLIVRHPGSSRSGHRVSQGVSQVDLCPTLIECLNVHSPIKSSGRSLVSALRGEPLAEQPCLAETEIPFVEHRWAPQHCLIDQDWKYIRSPRPELYDLKQDPAELNNLASEQSEKVDRLEAMLSDCESKQLAHIASEVELSSADRRALASLGYVGSRPSSTAAVDANYLDLPDIKDRLQYHELIEDANHFLNGGRPDEAVKILQGVVEAVPDYFSAKLYLGDALAASGRLNEALEIFQNLATTDPQRSVVHARLASAFELLGRKEEALAQLQQAVDLSDDATEYVVSLGVIYVQLDEPVKAKALFDRAIQIDPACAHFELGKMFSAAGDLKSAITCYQRTLESDPNWVPLFTELAVLYAREKRMDEATVYAKKAIAVNPLDADAHYNLGLILSQQFRFPEALESLGEALRLNPAHVKAVQQRDLIRSNLRKGTRAQP